MKANYPILILMLGLGGVILPGCVTSSRHAAVVQPPPATSRSADDTSDDLMADDLSNGSSQSSARGNPEALAHYAAGVSYEWNDEDALAVKQFDDAALADPSNEGLVIKVAQRFLKNKQPDKAVTVLAKSARRSDASGFLLSWLARADLQAGKTNQALAASRLSIQRQPDAFDG
jgi:predicted Zn-dependent protease